MKGNVGGECSIDDLTFAADGNDVERIKFVDAVPSCQPHLIGLWRHPGCIERKAVVVDLATGERFSIKKSA